MPRAFGYLDPGVRRVAISKTIVNFGNLHLLYRPLLTIRLSGYLFVYSLDDRGSPSNGVPDWETILGEIQKWVSLLTLS